MGWTWSYARHYKNGKIDRKAECDEEFNFSDGDTTYRVLKSAMVGTVYYAAVETVKDGKRDVWAAICETSTNKGEFGYKDMDETCGPVDCKCPKSILQLLTETDNEWANKWRKRCLEYANRKKVNFAKFPIGAVVSFISERDSVAFNAGDKITIEKISKTRWYGMGYRWSVNTINFYRNEGKLTVESRG